MLASTVLLTLYLSIGVFMGFDVCDNGQYMTFYENFYRAPHSVGYHFMYYLSGVAGGALLWAFPWMGLLGMRVVGLLCITACMWLVYRILRNDIPAAAIVGGNVTSMLAFVSVPVTFCYDLLSVLIYLSAIALLWEAATGRRHVAALAGGALLGINIFVRTPNVLGLVFTLIPLAGYWLSPRSNAIGRTGLRDWAMPSLTAMCGAACGVAVVVALMALLGHLGIYLDNLSQLRSIAADSSGQSSHSLATLIMIPLNFYIAELYVWLKIATLIVVYTVLRRHLPHPALRAITLVAAAGAAGYMMWRMHVMQPLWALCAAGSITLIVTGNRRQKLLASIGLLLMIMFPLGSDNAYNNGSIIAMLAAPVAVAACIKHTRFMRMAPFLVVMAVCSMGHMATDGCYFDGGELWHKTATVDNKRVAGIMTTPRRAAIMNTVLHGIAHHIHAGDTLMVYGSTPMLNYLTATRPAMDCCWPELLGATMLHSRLQALDTTRPPVLRQLFSSIGKTFSQPTPQFLTTYGDEANEFMQDNKIAVLNEYLNRNRYRIVYRDTHYVLYIADK